MDNRPRGSAFSDGNLRGFFGDLIQAAAQNQRVEISPQLFNYVIDLLVTFQETAKFFVQKGVRVPVLADMLADALESDLYRRITILRQMGDTSLMVSGYFPEALSRRCVDLNYYQRMGEIAYSHLSSLSDEVNIFDELAERFCKLCDVITEVSEETLEKNYSVLKLLEYYTSSGSERVLNQLKKQRVIPFRANNSKKKNRILI